MPMTATHPLRVNVADLLRRPGSSRDLDWAVPLEGVGNTAARVPGDAPVRVQLRLERLSDGLVVRGAVAAAWEAACSRCIAPVSGTVTVHVDELFEAEPLEGETYPLEDDAVDLEPLVRDALALELPRVPLCRDDCAGLCPQCGTNRDEATCDCTTDAPDPRWAALRSLDL
ncbi:MAG: metal-binding protein [Acidimicrobiia bacterium]|nr:MAG: metal-binding protein [Acidimicrobiia bacterium]